MATEQQEVLKRPTRNSRSITFCKFWQKRPVGETFELTNKGSKLTCNWRDTCIKFCKKRARKFVVFGYFEVQREKLHKIGEFLQNLTVWKFQDFSVIQILRETNFGECRRSKPAIFRDSEFCRYRKFEPSKRASKCVKMADFILLNSPKIISHKILV